MDVVMDATGGVAGGVVVGGLAAPAIFAAEFAQLDRAWDAVDNLDFDGLSETERVELLLACDRQSRRAQASLVRSLAVLNRAQQQEQGVERGCTESEVCAATRWAPNTAQGRMIEAGMLSTRFPEALSALSRGEIAWAQARALVEGTATLDDDTARAVQARVLGRMAGQSPAATRRAVRRAVVAIDPNGAEGRHKCERVRRRLEWRPEEDGMATISLYTTAKVGAAMMAEVDRRAREYGPQDVRTIDQRRADTMAVLVLSGTGVRLSRTQGSDVSSSRTASAGTNARGAASGGAIAPSAVVRSSGTSRVDVDAHVDAHVDADTEPSLTPAAQVHVVVGIDTLLGADEEPGELRGYGPITAREARELAYASGSTWRRLLTAPDGTLTHADPHTYRPTAPVDRLVRLRDRHCSFPGCAMPAARCDLDHARPFDQKTPEAGGATVPQNLQALCRRHHRLKTAGLWTVERDADTDTTRWTSRSGHTYTTRPEPYVMA